MAMAASPTPNTTSIKAHNHPPYKEMIVSAIESLKERKGSSKTAIAKYIKSNYKNLPPTHNALLSCHLRRLKKQRVLQMVVKSYKLSDSGKALHNAKLLNPVGIPKRPGRPPKKLTPSSNLNGGIEKKKPGRPPRKTLAQRVGPPSKKRKPGRPRKSLSAAELILPRNMKSMVRTEKRKPGRPKKGLSPAIATALGEKRKPGRPRNVLSPFKPKLAATLALGEKRKRGRPKKLDAFLAYGEKRKPSRPKKLAAVLASGEKKRGRPKKLDAALASGENRKRGQPKINLGAALAPGERRKPGRPKKSSSPFMPKAAAMLAAGEKRKRGRPKKVSAVMVNGGENVVMVPLTQCTTEEVSAAVDSGGDSLLAVLLAANTVDEVSAAVENGGGIMPNKTLSSPEKIVGDKTVEGLMALSLPSATESGEKRKRGRPKKGLTPSTSDAVNNGDDGIPKSMPSSAPQKRGRPPKKGNPDSVPEN